MANLLIGRRTIDAFMTLSAFALFVSPSVSAECTNSIYDSHLAAMLYSYANASHDNSTYYSISGIGNEKVLLSPDLKPLSAQTLAGKIKGDPRFKVAKFVVLDWAFSRRGSAPYATQLEASLGKPVL